MDFLTGLQMYLVVAIALAGTSYWTLYKPAIQLLEEIVQEKTVYSGWLGFTIWNICATAVAPWTAFILLKNNNEEFIEQFAVALADKMMVNNE